VGLHAHPRCPQEPRAPRGPSTIARILRADGIPPAPERPTLWQTFLPAHWGEIAAADFFTTEVWTWHGLAAVYTAFVIDLPRGGSRSSARPRIPMRRSWARSCGTSRSDARARAPSTGGLVGSAPIPAVVPRRRIRCGSRVKCTGNVGGWLVRVDLAFLPAVKESSAGAWRPARGTSMRG